MVTNHPACRVCARFRTRLLVGAIAAFCLGIGLLIGYIGWNANRPAVAPRSVSFTSLPGLEGEPATSSRRKHARLQLRG
jgi:hypothetical protein